MRTTGAHMALTLSRIRRMNTLSASSSPRRRLFWWAMAAALAVGAAFFLWQRLGGGPAAGGPGGPRPVPVRLAEVLRQDTPRYLTGLGTVQPSSSVLVRSRVDGQLMRLHFEEGSKVKAGQLLAEIDPRPFENALNEAKGQLTKDKALLENARRDLARYAALSKGDYIAEQQVATQRSLVQQYEGVVRADDASVAEAQLQLDYSRITAPVDGVTGLRQVDAGNMIRASDANGLVRINSTAPSDVVFTLPETELHELLAARREAAQKDMPLPVQAYDRDQKTLLAQGFLHSMDNQIDTSTGTVKLKARFPNEDDSLFPNQFVNARLRVRVRPDAVVVPAAAVQLGSQGSFVYTVEDGKAHMRKVKPAWRSGDVVVLDEGVEPGQKVVVDGVDRLRDNMPVLLPGAEGGPPKGQGGKKAKP